jgi:hypothetical protein
MYCNDREALMLTDAVLNSFDNIHQTVVVLDRMFWEHEGEYGTRYLTNMKRDAWIAIGEAGMVPIEKAQISYRRSNMFSPNRATQDMPENSDWDEIEIKIKFKVRFLGE